MIEVMSMMGASAIVFMLPMLLLPFLCIYLLHDYSGRREGRRDPMLGAKVFTTLLMTMSAQIALLGLTIVAVSQVTDISSSEHFAKTGGGLLLAGFLVGVYPTGLYFAKVRSQVGANIAHQAVGLNALLAGVAFMGATVALSQSLFHDANIAELAVIAAIYGGAMACAGWLLLKSPSSTASPDSTGTPGSE